MTPGCGKTVVAELVWDCGCTATGLNEAGAAISVGHAGEWTPEHLLALAAASSLMSTFFQLAGDVELDVLGYVATARLDLPASPADASTLVMTPCVVVGSVDDAARARALLEAAACLAPMHRLLAARVTIEADTRVITPSVPCT